MQLDWKKIVSKYKLEETQFVYILAALVFLVAIFLLSWFAWQYFISSANQDMAIVKPDNKVEEDCDYWRVLDGICVKTKKQANPQLVAVMIDNHYDARPPVGLAAATVVYEVPVEAEYTRFMAFYPVDVKISKVGPVRSARPYLLDWAQEYGDALYMHVGGSPEALNLIKDYKVNNLNEFYRGWYYWRDEVRSAPHNVYTSSELWNKALSDYQDNYLNDKYKGWQFATNTVACEQSCVNEVIISYLTPVYEAEWIYNTSTEQYGRWQMGELHTDEAGEQIVADTIIIQHVESQVIDVIGRKKINTVGSGEVEVFQKGNYMQGTWNKTSRTDRTLFINEAGASMSLTPGKIWVEVVDQNNRVSFE